jgi:hypothetical protein
VRLALAAAASVALLAPVAARADITVRLDREHVRAGEWLRATSASCCDLSLYLVPATLVPRPFDCQMRNGVMAGSAPWSVGPPHRRGWVWVGRFFPHRPTFRFRTPALAPGSYRAVVYCAPCYRGPRGSLIAGTQTLRIF